MSCDYTDIIVPIDYVTEAFEYANRKQFHRWKMIGMQVGHSTVGDIQKDIDGNITAGLLSGCLPIEEVNQNNHIIGRGAYYFRHKSTATGVSESAAYGIQGHCNTPGLEDGNYNYFRNVNNNGLIPTDAFSLEDEKHSPMYRGWGRPLGKDLCFADGAGWHMAVFIKDDVTQYTVMYYDQDEDCSKAADQTACAVKQTRRTGRFTAIVGDQAYRTCEAMMVIPIENALNSRGPCALLDDQFVNDINGSRNQSPFRSQRSDFSLTIKLTSLPSCNNFKPLKYTTDYYVDVGNGEIMNPEVIYPCERAVIRFSTSCSVFVAAGSDGFGAVSAEANYFSPVREYHYDRWDVSEEYLPFEPDKVYKIFDEVYRIEEFGLTVRVLTHSKDVIEKYLQAARGGEAEPGYEVSNSINRKFVTGGKSTDVLGSALRGCRCSNQDGQDIEKYPIRPYNQFIYCPNNFTCEKTCND